MSENTEEKETGEVVNEATTEQNAENAPSAEAKVAELNDKYLRLYSDFDNFRKRSIKEKMMPIKMQRAMYLNHSYLH